MENTEKTKLAVNQKRRTKTNVNKKNSRTNSKITKIGTTEYINKDTGEIETFNVIEEHDQDFNFEKIWLGHLLESLSVLGNAKIKVLNYLLANKMKHDAVLYVSKDDALCYQFNV